MKPTSPSDFQRNEATDPGGSAAEPEAAADAGDEDEFPSEATRIDPGYNSPRPAVGSPAPSRTPPPRASAPSAAPSRSSGAGNDPQQAKLAALKSLSLDAQSSGGSKRLPPPPKQGGGGSKLPWILLVGVLGAVGYNTWRNRGPNGIGIGIGAGGGTTGGTAGKNEIRTEVIAPTGGSGQTHMAAGYIAAQDPIAVSVPQGGRIQDVKVENNQHVKARQLVVQLDDSSFLAERSVANAEIKAAQEAYSQTVKLLKAQAATPIEVARKKSELEIAYAKARPIQQKIDQCKVRATIDATVLEVLLRAGETVAPGAAVIKIADLTKLVAEVDINEADLVKIKRDQIVEVTSDALPDKRYKGKVREIAGQADKAKGTIVVKVALEVPDQSLRPGMSVKCAFQPVEGEKPRIIISRSSLTTEGDVWIVGADRRVSRRKITTQAAPGSSIEVLSGLSAGERIVVDAAQVHEGQVI